MVQKAQSGIEFITSYGFALIVIVAVMAVIFVFVSLPKSALPNRCNIYGALNCLDIAYFPNANAAGSTLVLEASDTQPGFMMIRGFAATLADPASTSGSCTPSIISQGGESICTATFSTSSNINEVYTGNATVSVIYCPTAKTASQCGSPSEGGALSFGASFQVHGSAQFQVPTVATSSTASTSTKTSMSTVSSTSSTSVSTVSTISSPTSTPTSTSTSSTSTSTSTPSTSTSTSSTSTITTVSPNSYIYCVGGSSSWKVPPATYNAPIINNAIGTWSPTTPYPIVAAGSAGGPSCVSYNGYVYCVGGATGANGNTGVIVANALYAPVSGSGIGTWSPTTSYPISMADPSCTAFNGYVYCVGGFRAGNPATAIYYAPVSGSGIGTWTKDINNYPIAVSYQSCITSGGYIYCIGGQESPDNGDVSVASTYYAPVSGSGIGTWTKTTPYPIPIHDAGCALYNGYVYCVGGYESSYPVRPGTTEVYSAPVSSTGIGAWTANTTYPLPIYSTGCATSDNGYIYCVGGSKEVSGAGLPLTNVYTSPIINNAIGTWTANTPYPLADIATYGTSDCFISTPP